MAKSKPSAVSWWVSVYNQEPSEKRSKEERCVICEDLSQRAGLHKAHCLLCPCPCPHPCTRPCPCPWPAKPSTRGQPSPAPGEGSMETTTQLTSDFSVHADKPQLQNHSQFKHILEAKILTPCPFWCLLALVINDSTFREGCDTDNLMVASFSQMPRYSDALSGYSQQISEICY